MPIRENIVLGRELRDFALAAAVLIVAFALTFSGGLIGALGDPADFLYKLPIVAVGVLLSFVLHELMHKFVAQRYGAIAGFQSSQYGLIITLITGIAGFLIGIPGATMIYVHNFTRRENGLVALAGPLTNFAIFAVFFSAFIILHPAQASYLYDIISFTIYINLLLAFFNMLPIPPLDGSKVMAWNMTVYVVVLLPLLGLLLFEHVLQLQTLLFMLIFALLISTFYRQII